MAVEWKNFDFQETDWLISFPGEGNEGRKYLYYSVKYTNRKTRKIAQVCLTEIVDTPEFECKFPYTIGFFKGPIDLNLRVDYLEIRVIKSIDEFWRFLNDLNI